MRMIKRAVMEKKRKLECTYGKHSTSNDQKYELEKYESEISGNAAYEAAPMRKLWPL